MKPLLGVSLGKEVVVVKMARSQQSFLIDIPAIGEKTVQCLKTEESLLSRRERLSFWTGKT